jgi:hypothetical protein
VRTDASAIGGSIRDYQHSRDVSRVPPTISPDQRRQTSLPIRSANQFLHVDDFRLDFDHEQRPAGRVPRQQIDYPSLASNSEGDLRDHLPTEGAKQPRKLLGQRCVSGIEQAIKLAPSPASNEVDSDVKRQTNRP